jgi:hypothetical protein
MVETMNAERDAALARQAVAVAAEAAQQRDKACLDSAWPGWWSGIGSALEGVAEAAAGVMGRPVFRVSGGGDWPWTFSLISDPSAASILLVSDLSDPSAVVVTVQAPGRGREIVPRRVIVDGDRLQVGVAKDPAGFVRAVVEPWLRMVCPFALGAASDVLGRAGV